MATPKGHKRTPAEKKYNREWQQQKNAELRQRDPDYWRRWVSTPEQKERHRQAVRKVYADKLEILRLLKSQPCVDCGREFPYCAMEFDHRVPRKGRIFNWATKSLDTILKEMESCDIVCACCHAIRECIRRKRHHSH